MDRYSDFHERVLEEGATPNGVFATKLHAAQLMALTTEVLDRARPTMPERAAVMAELFANPTYIWLRRRDPVAQAVSWVKAVQTARWWEADVAPAPMRAAAKEPARFDYQHLERSMFALQKWDGVWRSYFAATGISPVEVWYEDLVDDRVGTVRRVLEGLGVDAAAPDVSRPAAFRRQADETSARWAQRFAELLAARGEGTFASLAGLHAGEPLHVCTGGRADIARDAITISVDGAPSPEPVSYALYSRSPSRRPRAGVVVSLVDEPIDHPFVVPMRLGRDAAERGQGLDLSPSAAAVDYAVGLAGHLGATAVHVS